MKKRIKDLKLGDTVYRSSGGYTEDFEVLSISKELLLLRRNGSKYDEVKFEMKEEDLTRFQFEADKTWKYNFFLSRLDALKKSREYLDDQLERIFNKQQDFLAKIKEANNSIRKVDEQIAEELKSTL